MAIFRMPPAPTQMGRGVAALFGPLPEDPPLRAPDPQQFATASIRPAFTRPQSTATAATLFPTPAAQDTAPPGYSIQLLVAAAYRSPFSAPQATVKTAALFPPPAAAQDTAPPGYSAQLLAQAAYRPTPRNPVLVPPNAAVLDYYEIEASVGSDTIQYQTWAAYRPPFFTPIRTMPFPGLFDAAAGSSVPPLGLYHFIRRRAR